VPTAQAGGIGRHCHGFNCAQTSLMIAVITFVGVYHPEYLLAAVFGGQGLVNLALALVRAPPCRSVDATPDGLACQMLHAPSLACVDLCLGISM